MLRNIRYKIKTNRETLSVSFTSSGKQIGTSHPVNL